MKKWCVVNAAETISCTISTLTQGCQVWLQSRSNCPPKWTNHGPFHITCHYILALDLFHLGPIGPTLEPTLTSLPDTRNQYYVSVNYGLGFRVPVGLDLQDSFKTKKVLNQTSHPTVYACVTNDLFGNDITCVLLTSNNSSFVQFELFLWGNH